MKRIILVICIVAVLVSAGFGVQALTGLRAKAKTAQFNEDVENLFIALQQYKERIGSYPVGSNEEVVKAMMGNNSKNLIILVGRKKDLSSKGEVIDPWGTPLRIYFSGAGILVRSAGPNKRFDDSTVLNPDDYYRSN
jgi:type II secretory pathway pseudopilin PulG